MEKTPNYPLRDRVGRPKPEGEINNNQKAKIFDRKAEPAGQKSLYMLNLQTLRSSKVLVTQDKVVKV